MSGKPSGRGYVKKLKEKNIPKSGPSLKYQFSNEYWNRMDRVVKRMGVPNAFGLHIAGKPDVPMAKPFQGGYIRGQGISGSKNIKKFHQDPEGRKLLPPNQSWKNKLKKLLGGK